MTVRFRTCIVSLADMRVNENYLSGQIIGLIIRIIIYLDQTLRVKLKKLTIL